MAEVAGRTKETKIVDICTTVIFAAKYENLTTLLLLRIHDDYKSLKPKVQPTCVLLFFEQQKGQSSCFLLF